MLNSSEVLAQIFLALESVEKSHNEIFIGLESGYLAGFRLFGGHVALLLTDKKINFPMVSMGIKSASERLKQTLEEEQQLAGLSLSSENNTQDKPPTEPTDERLIPVINQYVYILTEYLGPAAGIVVEDAVEEWKGAYEQAPNNLTYLIALLENELDTIREKQLFRLKVEKVPLPDM